MAPRSLTSSLQKTPESGFIKENIFKFISVGHQSEENSGELLVSEQNETINGRSLVLMLCCFYLSDF